MSRRDRITPEEVDHVARLACLEIAPEERETFIRQLNDILDYVAQLESIATEGLEATFNTLPLRNVFREDDLGESLPAEDILANAPERDGVFFKMPRILEGK